MRTTADGMAANRIKYRSHSSSIQSVQQKCAAGNPVMAVTNTKFSAIDLDKS